MRVLKRLNVEGDTIVEVLICMAIVSFSLGVSYGIARRSLIQVRVAEERTQALKLAEQQVSRIKQYITNNSATAFLSGPCKPATASSSFYDACNQGQCIVNDTVTGNLKIIEPVPNPIDPNCAVDQSGGFDLDDESPTSSSIVDSLYPYRAGFVYDTTNDQFYIFAGRYTAAGGGGVNTNGFDVVTLFYRAHP